MFFNPTFFVSDIKLIIYNTFNIKKFNNFATYYCYFLKIKRIKFKKIYI